MTLHPKGSLRARFEHLPGDMFRRLDVGARGCDLGDEGLYLAEELVAADRWLGGGDPETLGILVLALMVAQRQGSTRLPLDPKGQLHKLVGDVLHVAKLGLNTDRVVKAIVQLTGAPRFNSVIGAGDARLPLIVDDGCLYTERSRWLEQRVAERLAARLRAPSGRGAEVPTENLSAEQRAAATTALSWQLAVVTGGPGTGKTMVAAAIVRGLARQGVGPIALAAQTGKAANRLTEVMAAQLAAIAQPSDTDRALAANPPVAQTLHRLLGSRGHGFAHHAQSPLAVGALLVDESSMIDLALMDALLDALPATAPLILIGDANQLPAIDPGQILADLVRPELSAHVVTLTHSYRMDAADPRGRAVLAAATAVNSGATARLFEKKDALATPRTPGTLTFGGVEWVDTIAHPPEATAEALWHHFDGPHALRLADTVFRFDDGAIVPQQRAELERLWFLLNRARVLAVTRSLPTGSVAINAHLHELALARMSLDRRPELVPGEPVMITANDYQRGLFNGDQGIVVRADEGLGTHHFRAVFRSGGALRPFAIEALRDRLELAWAITVHKSQGSEVDAVALIMPADDLPIVTRELLYTGITRARTGVVLAGSRNVIASAGKRNALRESGLARRLGS